MVRVIYLLTVADRAYRRELIAASLAGRPWTHKGKRRRVTDRDMVDLAQKLHGWTESVYRFGCAFIHLSGFHDYRQRDPLAQLAVEEREALLRHMRSYHGGPSSDRPTFQEIARYLPAVFMKVSANLECYLQHLEKGGSIDDDGA